MNRIEKGSLLVLAIIVAFNIFFGLGSIPLLDPDEPVCAETAREMISLMIIFHRVFIMNIGLTNRQCITGL